MSDVPAYLQSLYRASVQPYLISWFKYNPRTVIASVNVPVLIVQGKNDIQVSVEDAEFLKKGCPAAELLLIDKMNHVLKDCESKGRTAADAYLWESFSTGEQCFDSFCQYICEKTEMIWEK